jgi:hypothetical protein
VSQARSASLVAAAFQDEETCRRLVEEMVWPKGRFCHLVNSLDPAKPDPNRFFNHKMCCALPRKSAA